MLPSRWDCWRWVRVWRGNKQQLHCCDVMNGSSVHNLQRRLLSTTCFVMQLLNGDYANKKVKVEMNKTHIWRIIFFSDLFVLFQWYTHWKHHLPYLNVFSVNSYLHFYVILNANRCSEIFKNTPLKKCMHSCMN